MVVSDVMTVRTAKVRSNVNLHSAAEITALSGASDLMVVDTDNSFVGVISEGDILRAALPDLQEVLAEGGDLQSAYARFVDKGTELSARPIAPIVIRDPLTVSPDEPVAKAATLMVDRQIRRLPVVQDGKLVGTVSRADICRAVVGLL